MTLEEALALLKRVKAEGGAWNQNVTTTNGESFNVTIYVFGEAVAYIRSPHEWHRRRSELLQRFPKT